MSDAMTASQESPVTIAFRKWLESKGAYIHPSVFFAQGKYGSSVFTSTPLEMDCKIVSCPFDLIITPNVARNALQSLSGGRCPLSDREALGTYLTFHSGSIRDKISERKEGDSSTFLRHQEYIDTLPQNGIITPLSYTEEELELLRGTTLHRATIERNHEWHIEWQTSRQWIQSFLELGDHEFTWDQFLRAQSWLSSRAFPSSLMAEPPSLSSNAAVPVLIPLVDALNHARGTPISWSVDQPEQAGSPPLPVEKSLSLVSHKRSEALEEIFNNYGAKPNDQLLFSYGFTLPNNPEDLLLLKLPGSERRFNIMRGALGESQAVWDEIGRRLQESFATDEEDLDIAFAELQLEIGQIFPEMLRDLRDKLPLAAAFDGALLPGVRPEVRAMIWNYVEGKSLYNQEVKTRQREILDDLLAFADQRLNAAVTSAQELGIEIALESEDDE